MKIDLNVLSDEIRRLILVLLYREGELCVCELTEAISDIQPKVSRQLSILKNASWLVSRREGTRIYYRLARLPAWAEKLVESLCEGGVPSSTQRNALERIKSFRKSPGRGRAA
jgi:ArsR family transcriptional regulator